MVADPQGMILNSKEYYAPIITPFEAHLAFAGGAEWTGEYHLDFAAVLVRLGMSRRQNHLSLSSREHTVQEPRWRRFTCLPGTAAGQCSAHCKPSEHGAQQLGVSLRQPRSCAGGGQA